MSGKAKAQTKHEENRIFLLNNPHAPRLCPELAAEIGLNESIIFLQIEFWIAVTGHVRDGRKWTYQSVRDIQKVFPYWGVATINRTIASLEKMGLITVGNFNERKADRTRWFAINMMQASKLKSIHVRGLERIEIPAEVPDELPENPPEITPETPVPNRNTPFQNGTHSAQFGTPSAQFGTTLPETSTDISSKEDNYVANAPSPAPSKSKPPKKSAKADYAHGSLMPLSHPFHAALMKVCNVKASSTDAKKRAVEEAARDLFADGHTPEQCEQFLSNWWSHKFGQAYFGKAPTAKDLRDHFEEVINLAPVAAAKTKNYSPAELDAMAAKYANPQGEAQ